MNECEGKESVVLILVMELGHLQPRSLQNLENLLLWKTFHVNGQKHQTQVGCSSVPMWRCNVKVPVLMFEWNSSGENSRSRSCSFLLPLLVLAGASRLRPARFAGNRLLTGRRFPLLFSHSNQIPTARHKEVDIETTQPPSTTRITLIHFTSYNISEIIYISVWEEGFFCTFPKMNNFDVSKTFNLKRKPSCRCFHSFESQTKWKKTKSTSFLCIFIARECTWLLEKLHRTEKQNVRKSYGVWALFLAVKR